MELYVRSDTVVSRVIAGEVLIVPISKGVGDLASIYSLNPVASAIWEAISVLDLWMKLSDWLRHSSRPRANVLRAT